MVATQDIIGKGPSAGLEPNHVKTRKLPTNTQNSILYTIVLLVDEIILFFSPSIGIKITNSTEEKSANTPPILLGIARRIAYANRKYHSGWMW